MRVKMVPTGAPKPGRMDRLKVPARLTLPLTVIVLAPVGPRAKFKGAAVWGVLAGEGEVVAEGGMARRPAGEGDGAAAMAAVEAGGAAGDEKGGMVFWAKCASAPVATTTSVPLAVK